MIIAPSLLASDFSRLAHEIERVERAGADWLHLDIMDGHFVPNLTMGPMVVESIRKATSLYLDTHLMIEDPEAFIDPFANAGVDGITFHLEAMGERIQREKGYGIPKGGRIDWGRVRSLAKLIRDRGKKAGLAVNPGSCMDGIEGVLGELDLILMMTVWPGFGGQSFMEEVMPAVRRVREMDQDIAIEVDGGLKRATVSRAVSAGANVIVAGTALFRSRDIKKAILELRVPDGPC